MAKARPRKKREREASGQLPLPQQAAAPHRKRAPDATKDRRPPLVDQTAEWTVVGRLYTTNAGKTAHIRVKRVDQPTVTEIRTWGAHERITVKRNHRTSMCAAMCIPSRLPCLLWCAIAF